jgi:L-rhamnose mutarotase
MLRFGSGMKLRRGAFDEYRAAHAAVWPEVQEALARANIRNDSIYCRDGFSLQRLRVSGR